MLSLVRNGINATNKFVHSFNIIHVANFMGKTSRGKPLKLKKPFPYQKRKIFELEAMWDITAKRVEEENAKIIVVDGPIAAGKTAVCRMLAEEFEMAYFPPVSMDEFYITRSGYDLRNMDDQLPVDLRSFDHRNFCLCPTQRKQVAAYQVRMGLLRYAQYIDALAHILNTGQGVILERSFFSECAFTEAMYLEGFLNKDVRDYYFKLRDICSPLLLKPHVVIYLDVPVPVVQERIKQRNYSYEINSPALTASYLEKLENHWKNNYLKEADEMSHVLVYDWTDGGDVDLMIEDLENLDLDALKSTEFGRLSDWKTWRLNWRQRRLLYTNDKVYLVQLYTQPAIDIPDLLVSHKSHVERSRLYQTAPGNEYSSGANPVRGDSLLSIILGFRRTNPRAFPKYTGTTLDFW